MDEEARMLGRLKRRLASARASVMLEFAFVAPLVAVVAIFAADFTRILRTEQQLEIANRLAADVEAHMADYYAKGESPGLQAKNICKRYLVKVAHVATETGKVYMKGGCGVIKNPISVAIAWVADFLDGSMFDDGSLFLKILGKLLGGIMNFVTFGTVKYLTDVVPHDREVWVSTAAYIPTILPAGSYGWLTLSEHEDKGIGVCQFAPDLEASSAAATAWSLKLNAKKRHRVYCYMPVVDAVPVAPVTYVRKFKSWCAKQKWAKGLID